MNRLTLLFVLLGLSVAPTTQAVSADPAPMKGFSEVHSSEVILSDGYWGPRVEIAQNVTIHHALDKLEQRGYLNNFDKAAGLYNGKIVGHNAYDSDLHKAMEGAWLVLQNHDDPALKERADSFLDRILAAQGEDGYLISYYTDKPKSQRWVNMRSDHQLYNAGHFFEMAVEHYRATGDPKALNAAKRFADHIGSIFGEGKIYAVGGHQEIELALVKLYRATGERKYLDMSRFFCDQFGHVHGIKERKRYVRSEIEMLRGPDYTKLIPNWDDIPPKDRGKARREFLIPLRNGRMQDHMPLVEQTEAVGHAVRAGYIYSAMADMARFMDAPEYEQAAATLWEDVVYRKLYLTGGVGNAQYKDEGHGEAYNLPNRTYCESCSGIANVMWNHRMALLTKEAKYADVMELSLHNAAISGINLDGKAFFYTNPLESNGAKRSAWIGLACCPTNYARFMPQVGGYIYGVDQERLAVNLFMAGEATVYLGDTPVKVKQETDYPWKGKVKITVGLDHQQAFNLTVRIPTWALGQPIPGDLYRYGYKTLEPVTLNVNGKAIDATPRSDGYIHLNRRWNDGDTIELDLPMEPRRVYAHENVEANRGRVALMRGPIVYCIEGADHAGQNIFNLSLPKSATLATEHRPNLLGGVTVIKTKGIDEAGEPVSLTAVPYYAWANRATGPMQVWVKEKP
jgi:hypothetical protein